MSGRPVSRALGAAVAVVLAVTATAAAAQTGSAPGPAPSGPSKDRQIRLILSTGVAGGYAAYANLLTRYFGNHLPGNPTFIVQSMPGGGGLRATNYVYAQGPKDGSMLAMVHSTAPLAPLYGAKAALYDPRKFSWIGSMNSSQGLCVSWHASPVKTWQDMLDKQFIVGSSGAGSQMEILPSLLNKFLGTKIKIVSGYKNGTDIFLAMERGEVDGRCGGLVTVMQLTHPDWLPERKVTVPIQVAAERNPMFPDSPSVMDFVKDERARQVFELAFATQDMDRPVLAPPGLPERLLAELRAGFDATMKDPAFRQEADAQHLDIDAITGASVARILERAYALPADVIDTARELMGTPSAD